MTPTKRHDPTPRSGQMCGSERVPLRADNGTWVEGEEFACPHGGFTRRAFVRLRRNRHNAIELPYGERRLVRCSIPDTAFSIPARLTHQGRTVVGFVSDTDGTFTFTPEADDTREHDSASDCCLDHEED